MKTCIFIITTLVFLFSCDSKQNKKVNHKKILDSVMVTSANIKSERFIPENKEEVKFDTIIADKQIQITITRTDLDSYVVHEYEDDGKTQIDKYRDAEITLKVKQKSQIILDTVLRKDQFSKYAEKGFMNIANFHNYWFNTLENGKIELFGVISKPETDWSLDFHHYFDLTTKRLSFKEEINDEE